MNLNELTIVRAHQGLVKKEFSSVELTEAVLARIRKRKAETNAYLEIIDELALSQAKKVDRRISQGEKISLLAGVPAAIKDNLLLAGIKCTAASRILENYIAPYHATAIKKLIKEGAVFVGKTNLDEFAMGSSTENSAFGSVRHPLNPSLVPGGSSGGSAAAVADHQAIYALGSDTGGSIRQPCSFCGVVGLKPTYGRVSRYGLIAFASSLDQIGPLAKSVEDARIVFDAIKGVDEMDATSLKKEAQPTKQASAEGLKIGVPKEYFMEGMDSQVAEEVRKAIAYYQAKGARIIDISLPYSGYALSCYYIIMPAEASANLARYDGVKYGLAETGEDLLGGYLKTRQEGFGDEVRRRIMIGTYVLSAGYYDAYYLKAQKVRTLIKKDFEKAFEKVDVIMGPTTPTPAFGIGEKADDPVAMYLSDVYTVAINLAGMASVSIPCRNQGVLPIGLQIIGPQMSDEKILQVAGLYQQAA